MELPNTREYYRDLTHHHLQKGRVLLALFFDGLADPKKHTHSHVNHKDWFVLSGTPKPVRDEQGHFLWGAD